MPNKEILGSLAILPPVWHNLAARDSNITGEIFQTSLISALLDGVYEGSMTYGELHKHGNFGLGTFNDLDGEMVGFSGNFYQLRSDGSAHPVSNDQRTPFAVVTFFKPERELEISEKTTKSALMAIIEGATEENVFTAIQIDGSFEYVNTRTVEAQKRPFPPLVEATAHEAVREFNQVQGTIAGFRTPAYAQGIGVAGFHLHFLRSDRNAGGHVLDYVVQSAKVQLCTLRDFHVELPASRDFLNASLSGDSISGAIKASEG